MLLYVEASLSTLRGQGLDGEVCRNAANDSRGATVRQVLPPSMCVAIVWLNDATIRLEEVMEFLWTRFLDT